MRLERSAIVQKALELLDEFGADGVSTRRLATALGVKGPSLYWHFASMRELFDHMAEAMLAQALPSPDPLTSEPDWRRWLEASARAIRRAALSRRDGARVLSGSRPTGSSPLLDFPAMVRRLEGVGFSHADARHAILALGRYVLGWAIYEQAAADRASSVDADAGFEFGLQAMLAGLEAQLGR
jgi:TetR/AcrR family tetracycline transcriptional repressor